MILVRILLPLLLSTSLCAAPAVRVLALFPDKAMLEIDGERKVLAAGERGPGGVRLISADSRAALVEIAGRREELRLGSAVSTSYAQAQTREVRIVKDLRGGYFVDGLINGQAVRFLVDTGATSVALSAGEARRLGIAYQDEGLPVAVSTASGDARGFQVKLRSLAVAGLRLNDVRAVVIEGEGPSKVLLGMNVLSRFEIDQRENLLVLRERF